MTTTAAMPPARPKRNDPRALNFDGMRSSGSSEVAGQKKVSRYPTVGFEADCMWSKYFDHMQSASKPTVGYLDTFFWPATSLLPEDRMPSKFNALGSFLLGLAGGIAAVVVI